MVKERAFVRGKQGGAGEEAGKDVGSVKVWPLNHKGSYREAREMDSFLISSYQLVLAMDQPPGVVKYANPRQFSRDLGVIRVHTQGS